ncbi:MAG: methyltransferase domain-containing protein [Anaerolineae bacterium]|nr:methyltransferase domain-containing protein [Anaerolineae bacterium]MDW8173492.1 methyltransferase domain-containing protein [Anaerolineae bacterium]
MTTNAQPRICDYENATYRQDFWEGGARVYEDLVERRLIARLLPPGGRRLLELGAGYGRLSREYRADQVVLLDYSLSQLREARQTLGDERFIYVAADAYHLPFQAGVFDRATMIRVLHHFEDVPRVLNGIRRVLAPGAYFLLEYANKRHLKALIRHALGRQAYDPNDPAPIEFVEMNFNFHPDYIAQALQNARMATTRRLSASYLRMGALKRALPTRLLVALDEMAQASGWLVGPSVFALNQAQDQTPDQVQLQDEAIFACPHTGRRLQRQGDALVSPEGRAWPIRDGIYVFKQLDS